MFGGAISWHCKKQTCVALPIVEAEYISLCAAIQEAILLMQLTKDLGLDFKNIEIREDNQGYIALSKNSSNHGRTKHIDIKYHYIRTKILDGSIKLSYCQTD